MTSKTHERDKALALANRLNSDLTSRMLAAGASAEQILQAIEITLAHAPQPAPHNAQQTPDMYAQGEAAAQHLTNGQPNFQNFAAPMPPTSFDADFLAGQRAAMALKEKGYRVGGESIGGGLAA